VSRAARLLELLQVLRRYHYPVTGTALASELGISLRTLYRDIGSLQAQGATIDGEAGVGYRLRPGFALPPLMFATDELEALALGSRWVAQQGDTQLSLAARNALAKIASVLPTTLREELDSSAMLVGPAKPGSTVVCDLAVVRRAIRTERKLSIAYRDRESRESRRKIWPFALGFFEEVRVIAAWCETRLAYRHFRADRIQELAIMDERYPRKRTALLREWRDREKIPPGE
jgi:predicted DNA-binding transcriptional regulator YafY